MTTPVPILISIVQFHDALTASALKPVNLLESASRLGALGVEYRDNYWTDRQNEIATIRRVAAERGQKLTYATMATLFTTDDDHAARVRADIDDAVALGSAFLRVFQGSQPSNSNEPAWDRARKLVDYASDRGVIIALENFRIPPGNRLNEIAAVLDAIPSPALGTNVDIGNYGQNDQDATDAIAALGNRVVMSHLSDKKGAASTWLGDGSLPLQAIFEAFGKLPQPVIHCLEFEGGPNPEERIAVSFDAVRDWLPV
jgi:sugar phosphate isomerase/epimerase